jgi:hypothetical protein
MVSGPAANFWRAPVDNDAGGNERSYKHRWLQAGLNDLQYKLQNISAKIIDPHAVRITVEQDIIARTGKIDYTAVYTVFGSGDILVDNMFDVDPDLPPLPRVGISLHIPKDCGEMTWYGRGPHESYWDRKTGAATGIYSGLVADQYVPYLKPQENGNKTDVRWVEFKDENLNGLVLSGMPVLNVNAHHYTIENLSTALHTYEIVDGENITVNIDLQQMGLGGDDSWNPRTHKEYLLDQDNYVFSFRITPVAFQDAHMVSENISALPVVCAPVITIEDTETENREKVSIASDAGNSIIFYTTDGTEPSENSMRYQGPFFKDKSDVVKTKVLKPGFISSVIVQSDFD